MERPKGGAGTDMRTILNVWQGPLLAAAGLGLAACGNITGGDKDGVKTVELEKLGVYDETLSGGSSAAALSSQAAFATSVWPIVKEHCAACHASTVSPNFASDSLEKAHAEVTNTQKVNLDAPEKSRLVLREKDDKHNCWGDCAANGDEFKAAIEKWAAAVKSPTSGGQGAEDAKAAYVTDAQPYTARRMADLVNPNADGSIVFEAETGTLRTPMITQINKQASSKIFIGAKNGAIQGVNIGDPKDIVKNPAVGHATFPIEVKTPASYRLYGRVHGQDGVGRSFWYRVDVEGAEPRAKPEDDMHFWDIGSNPTDQMWRWVPGAPSFGQKAELLDLPAGRHTLEVFTADDGSMLDQLAITTNPKFDATTAQVTPINRMSLVYDLSAQTGIQGLKFYIEAEQLDDKSYLFRRPRLVTPTMVWVRNIKPLINGVFTPQYAAYSSVDQVVAPPGAQLSDSALLMLTDKGPDADLFSFSFDAIEPITEAP
jgi:hypothetical protein